MSFVTALWSMAAAAALVLGVVHLLVWGADRRALANLSFAATAFAVALVAGAELGMMHARSAAEWGNWVRWVHVPLFVAIVGTVCFVQQYLRSGRRWLAWTIVVMRAAILGGNFAVRPNFNFREIRTLDRIEFLGEQVSVVGQSVVGRWQWLALLSVVLLAIYVVDAAIRHRRQGGSSAQHRSVIVAGGVLAFVLLSVAITQLVIYGALEFPVMVALPFMFPIGAMAFELSRDLFVAARLSQDLRESEQRLDLAASAAGLGLWSLDPAGRRVWATDRARALCGLSTSESLDLDRVITTVHPDDAPEVRRAVEEGLATSTEFTSEFRVRCADGSSRWLEARGRPGDHADGRNQLMRGVLRDITERRIAQEELSELRRELSHAGRVTMLGQLASSLAHELSQPLSAILRNAEAAGVLLRSDAPDLGELRGIVADIHRDDRRAGDVIDRLRALLKRRSLDLQPIAVESLVQDVAQLVRLDAIARSVKLEYDIDPGLPLVSGDRVHLSQVLLNLIINAMDATADAVESERRVVIAAHAGAGGTVELSVSDSGPGIPAGMTEKIFEPFFTSKAAGMGMGLPVSRTIVEAHGGALSAGNSPQGGAIFRFSMAGANDPQA